MSTRRTVPVVMLAAGVALVTVHAFGEDDVAGSGDDLRVRLAPGDEAAFTQTVEWELAQKAGRKKYGSKGVTHHDWVLTAEEAAEDGAVRVSIRFGRAWGHVEATKQPRVDFDTAAAELTPEEARAPVASPVHTGRVVSAILRKDGTFQDVLDVVAVQPDVVSPTPDAERYQQFASAYAGVQPLRELALLLPSLPARPMPSGTCFEDAGLLGAPGYFQYRIDRRTELARRNDTSAVVKCVGRIRDLTEPPKSTSRKKEGRRRASELAKGTYASAATVRRADGLPDEVNAQIALLLKVDFGDDGSGTQSSEWTMSLRRVEKAASGDAGEGSDE